MRIKSQISPPIIDHLGLRDLQIMPLKLGWREYKKRSILKSELVEFGGKNHEFEISRLSYELSVSSDHYYMS
jgi:hypothetical protein